MTVKSMTEMPLDVLTEEQWQIAHAIAQTLVKQETDVNELGKAIAYLRSAVNQNQPDAGSRFFKYLKTLVSNGRTIGHSGRTLDYYRNIENACSSYLLGYQTQPEIMLYVLGWVARLMRYYREGGAIGEIMTPTSIGVMSARQMEVKQVKQTQEFQVEILGTIKLTEKEPKKASLLQEGQTVQVKVVALKEDGGVKSIKCVS
jgi:hypothetical protein